MKLIMTCFALILVTSAVAQDKWYYSKYEVNDLAELTPEQYNLALKDAKNLSWASLFVSGAGVGIYFIGKSTVKNGLDEDATFIEELLGNEIVGIGTMGLGIVAAAGGIIGSIVGVTRLGMIKKSGRDALAPDGYLRITPHVIMGQHNSLASTGIALQITF